MIKLFERGLATWRIARMLVKEDGPGYIFFALREKTGIKYTERIDGMWLYKEEPILSYPWWNPLHCVICTSIYVAAIVMVLPRFVVQLFAASAVACILNNHGDQPQP